MPLILSDRDLQPLVRNPASIDDTIEVVERATLAIGRGEVRRLDRRPNDLEVVSY